MTPADEAALAFCRDAVHSVPVLVPREMLLRLWTLAGMAQDVAFLAPAPTVVVPVHQLGALLAEIDRRAALLVVDASVVDSPAAAEGPADELARVVFELLPIEATKTAAWCKLHAAHVMAPAIGGAFTYEVTPTSLGTVVRVRCAACGARFDATDYAMF